MTDNTYKFELHKTPQGYRFRLKDADGNTVGFSPAYHAKVTATGAIALLKQHMPTAEVHESSE